MAQSSNILAVALCRALGIDPAVVKGVTVEANAKNILQVRVDLIPTLADHELQAIADGLLADAKVVTLAVMRPSVDSTSLTDQWEEWIG